MTLVAYRACLRAELDPYVSIEPEDSCVSLLAAHKSQRITQLRTVSIATEIKSEVSEAPSF